MCYQYMIFLETLRVQFRSVTSPKSLPKLVDSFKRVKLGDLKKSFFFFLI